MDGIEDQTTENKPLVSKAVILFDLIRGNALPRDESRSLILEIARAMEVQVEPRWRKSSYSGNGGGTCVEVGEARRGVLVRDTTTGPGRCCAFSPAVWRRFAAQVKTGA